MSVAEGPDSNNTCEPCIDSLEHCTECSNSTTCTKCSHDFFVLDLDENNSTVCTCIGGNHVFYDPVLKECQCESEYARTTLGCVDLANHLGEECRITGVTNETTQLAFADQYLVANGSYAYCRTCAYGNFKLTEEDGEPVSKCRACSERFDGCLTCGADGDYCRRCKSNYIAGDLGVNMTCSHCNTFMDHCAECEYSDRCEVCEEGYRFGIWGNTCGTGIF